MLSRKTRPRRLAVRAVLAALPLSMLPLTTLTTLTTLTMACGSDAPDSRATAKSMAQGLAASVDIADRDPQPVLCARFTKKGAPLASRENILSDGSRFALSGNKMTVELSADRPAKLAIVADARQKSRLVDESIAALVKTWDREQVSVVVALGGMGQTKAELLETLAPIAAKGRALIAAPGDREGATALDEALAELRARDLPVFAGSEVRLISIAGATIGLLPGVGSESSLVSGGDGCLHREEDAAALADALGRYAEPRVWLSYAAPRQGLATRNPSDLSEGVHAGERQLTAAIARAKPQAVLHGQIAPAIDAPLSGSIEFGATQPTMIAVGAIEELPTLIGRGEAVGNGVIAEITAKRISWKRTRRVGPPQR